ncbi:MAG TPA: hypothetical protein VE733_00150 [Streptosporangiaceae bacterium]|nr:hypothetical protein [Streptosporangiaceae bacterium]
MITRIANNDLPHLAIVQLNRYGKAGKAASDMRFTGNHRLIGV